MRAKYLVDFDWRPTAYNDAFEAFRIVFAVTRNIRGDLLVGCAHQQKYVDLFMHIEQLHEVVELQYRLMRMFFAAI